MLIQKSQTFKCNIYKFQNHKSTPQTKYLKNWGTIYLMKILIFLTIHSLK